MPYRFMNIDFQMVGLNIASLGALIADVVSENATGWSVGFLIFTIGVLNLSKAYSTCMDARRKKKAEKKESDQ